MFEKTENGVIIEDRFYSNADVFIALNLYERIRNDEVFIMNKEDQMYDDYDLELLEQEMNDYESDETLNNIYEYIVNKESENYDK